MKKKEMNGSMTVEMSFLMPMVLFLIMGCIFAVFYYHDKNILAGAAYETAVVGSTKARERGGVKEGELEQLFAERVSGKCVLFPGVHSAITVTEEEVTVEAYASGRRMNLSVMKKARVTDPEKFIRDTRRIGAGISGTKNNN